MDHFEYRDGALYAEGVPLARIAAEVGTPVYVYSRATLERHARVFQAAVAQAGPGNLGVEVAYALKANPNLSVVRVLAKAGMGADVVSAGELDRALAGGMAAAKIVFSGVGKTDAELSHALDKGIGQFNIESEDEGQDLARLAAARGLNAPAVLRVNPDVDAGTHAKISTGKAENKFGVAISDAPAIYARLSTLPGLNLRGVALHIGSQIFDFAPLEAAFTRVGRLIADLRAAGQTVTHVDLGGGLGIAYRPDDEPRHPDDYGAMVARVTRHWGVTLMFEPGRLIAGNAGVLLTRVVRVKPGAMHPFVVVDAAMNDLARPALYDAYHHFAPVVESAETMTANIVGPVCESGDTFAMAREMGTVMKGDLAVFRTAGAYGATMASMYNSRAMVPEVLVDGDRYAVVAERLPPQATMDAENMPEWLA
jgi:diaminopimelate decarboxylase